MYHRSHRQLQHFLIMSTATAYHQLPKINALFSGVITTTSLTRQTSPDDASKQYKIPVIGTDGKAVYVPIITANSVRGLLRRSASDVLYEAMQRSGIQISKETYLSICRGAFGRTQIDSSGGTTQQAVQAASHLIAGLFGGGQMMWGSRLCVSDLLPIITPTFHLVRHELQQFAVEMEAYRLLTTTLMAPRDDFEKIPELPVLADLEAAYTDHQVTKAQQRAASKDGATKDDLNGFALNEAMIPGVPLRFEMSLKNVTHAQMGIVLEGLRRWANEEALGGGRARGFGSFHVTQMKLRVVGGETVDVFTGERPFIEFASPEKIGIYLDAMQQELQHAISPEVLALVFPTGAESKAGAAKAKK